jgi:hypothetical protein
MAATSGDTGRMHALRVSEREYARLWPEFPASRPEFNMPLTFAWRNLDLRSRRDAVRIVARLGGRPLRLGGVACAAAAQYGPFRVHRDCRVTVAHGADTLQVKLFGSAVEAAGVFKAIGILED